MKSWRRAIGPARLAGGLAIAAIFAGAAGAAGPDSVGELCREAGLEAQSGRLSGAVLDYNRGLATSPQDPRPYVGLAVLYEAVGRSDLAVETLQQLRLANPEAPHLSCRLTEAYLGAEDARMARELGAAAIAREPSCARALSSYGLALGRARQWQSAAECLEQARRLEPEDRTIGEALVKVWFEGGGFRQAAELADRLSSRGETASLRFYAGAAYAQFPGEPEAAERSRERLLRAAELEPHWFEPHAELGQLYQRTGKDAEAATEFERAWTMNPNAPGVVYNLALLWRRSGNPRSEALIRRLPTLSRNAARLDVLRARSFQQPDSAQEIVKTAQAEAQQGRFAAALLRLRRLLDADSANLEALKAYLQIDRRARSGYPDYLRPGPSRTAA